MDRLKSLGESFKRKLDKETTSQDDQSKLDEHNSAKFPIKYIGSVEVTASKGMPICATTPSLCSTVAGVTKAKINNPNSASDQSKEKILNECLIELVDASECYGNAGYYKRSYDCERQAKLIALQLALRESANNSVQSATAADVSTTLTTTTTTTTNDNSNVNGNSNTPASETKYNTTSSTITNVLNLSIQEPQELVNTIINLDNFQEAYIVAEAYDYHLVWHRALFNNVILRGSIQYLDEFCRKCDLSESIVSDLVVLYKQHLLAIENRDSNNSTGSTGIRSCNNEQRPGSGGGSSSSSIVVLSGQPPGGGRQLKTSSSSSNLFFRRPSSSLTSNTALVALGSSFATSAATATTTTTTTTATTTTTSSSTPKPTVVKSPKGTTFTTNCDTDDDDDAAAAALAVAGNDDDGPVDDGDRACKSKHDKDNTNDLGYSNNNKNSVGADAIDLKSSLDVVDDLNNDGNDNELARLASSMQIVLERLPNIRLRFKIYTELNFTDAKEELVGRDASIAAYLKDSKLV